MNVLYLTYGLPYPPNSGARMRDFYLLREIHAQHPVTCLCLLEHAEEMNHAAMLAKMGIRIYGFGGQGEALWSNVKSLAQHVAAARPLATFSFWNKPMFEWVRERAAAEAFDLVQIEHSFLIPYRKALPDTLRKKTILDLHNVGALQYARYSSLDLPARERLGFLFKQAMMRGWEARLAEQFGRVLTVSGYEADWLRAQNPALVPIVIENGVDADACAFLPEPAETNTLLFVGTLGYLPNVDALRWFVREILPLVRQTLPDAALEIVGRAPRPQVKKLGEQAGIRVNADVAELKPFYANAQIVVAPLRAGGGTRLKILEAMAFGRAVVSTRMGCKGLDVRDGDTILLADTPQEFTAAVVRLAQDPALRNRIARNARELVEQRYSWKRQGQKLLTVYQALAA